MASDEKRCLSMNGLASFWYGVVTTLLQAYIVLRGGRKFLEYTESKYGESITTWETNLYIALQGVAIGLLPFIAFASFFKTGNLANDGYRLGRRLDLERDLDLPRSRHHHHHQRDPIIRSGSACGAAWRHCPPLGPSLHAISALCSLVASTVFEARLIKDQIVSRDHVWSTDLDFVVYGSFWPRGIVSPAQFADEVPLPSAEFVSYALALLAYSIRCSDVFWGANKCLSFLISLQLAANGAHALLAFCGASVLYKIELIGVPAALAGVNGTLSDYLLLDPPITIMLLMLLSLTLLLSCSPLSMYALNKLSNFLIKSRKKFMHDLPTARSYLWSFYPHLAALATLLAVAACAAPLLHDLSRMYKLNPQPVLLASVTGSIVHAFLWVALWLLLTAKTNWDFRLKISVGRAILKSPSCLALAAQVDFKPNNKKKRSEETEALLNEPAPTLILSAGKAYSVSDAGVQHKINQLVTQQQAENRGANGSGANQHQVYWLGGGGGEANAPSPSEPPTPSLPEPNVVGETGAAKRHDQQTTPQAGSASSNSQQQQHQQHQQTVQAPVVVNSPSAVMPNPSVVLSPILTRPVRKPLVRIPNPDDDGEYATLRDLPLVTLPEEPADMHETSSSSDSSGVDSGFDSSSRQPMSMPPIHSPRLVTRQHQQHQQPQRDLCNPYGYIKPGMSTFSPGNSNTIALHAPQTSSPANRAVFHSLPLGYANRPLSQMANGAAYPKYQVTGSLQIQQTRIEERRPAIQACLLAGQGFDPASS